MLSNTHFSIAVHVLCALAYNEDRRLASEDLARTVGTNPSFLRGLIGQLKSARLVDTILGTGGGTVLARPKSKITLHDVYQATESQPAIKAHECNDRSKCPVARGMEEVMSNVNHRIERVVESELKGITIADLVTKIVKQ